MLTVHQIPIYSDHRTWLLFLLFFLFIIIPIILHEIKMHSTHKLKGFMVVGNIQWWLAGDLSFHINKINLSSYEGWLLTWSFDISNRWHLRLSTVLLTVSKDITVTFSIELVSIFIRTMSLSRWTPMLLILTGHKFRLTITTLFWHCWVSKSS